MRVGSSKTFKLGLALSTIQSQTDNWFNKSLRDITVLVEIITVSGPILTRGLRLESRCQTAQAQAPSQALNVAQLNSKFRSRRTSSCDTLI